MRQSLTDPDRRDTTSLNAEIREAVASLGVICSILKVLTAEYELEDQLDRLLVRSGC